MKKKNPVKSYNSFRFCVFILTRNVHLLKSNIYLRNNFTKMITPNDLNGCIIPSSTWHQVIVLENCYYLCLLGENTNSVYRGLLITQGLTASQRTLENSSKAPLCFCPWDHPLAMIHRRSLSKSVWILIYTLIFRDALRSMACKLWRPHTHLDPSNCWTFLTLTLESLRQIVNFLSRSIAVVPDDFFLRFSVGLLCRWWRAATGWMSNARCGEVGNSPHD